MKLFRIIYGLYEILIARKEEAIYTCLKNDIPLTDENILHVIDVLKQKKKYSVTKELIINKKQNQ